MEQFSRPQDGDQNRGPVLVKVDVVFTAAAIIATFLRVSARLGSTLKVSWDDYLIVSSTIFTVSSMALVIRGVENGFGRHGFFLSPQQLTSSLTWSDVGIILCFVANLLAKTSICAFLLRIQNERRLKWFLWLLIAGLILTAGPNIIVLLAQCQPLGAIATGKGRCLSNNVVSGFSYLQLSYTILQDIICSAMPVVLVWNLQMKRRLKVAICGLTGLGLITTATAVLRAVLLPQMNNPDRTWALVDISICFRLEVNLAIIAANMALLRLIYRFHRNHIYNIASSQPILTIRNAFSTISAVGKPSSPRTTDDSIPLNSPRQNQITKTTDVFVSVPAKPQPVYTNNVNNCRGQVESANWV